MDEKPDQIIEQIEARRDELGRNLSELETKVRRTADWHTYYDKNPMLILGAALGGGLLLGAVVGGSRSNSRTRGIRKYNSSWKPSSGTSGRSASPAASSSYYTPAESTASSFAGVGSGSAASVPQTPPSESAGSRASYTSGSSMSGSKSAADAAATMSNIGNKLQTLAGGQMHQVNEAIDHIRGALIAFGISKVKEFLSQSVPGLQQHLAEMGGQQHGSTAGSSPQTYGSASGMSGSGSSADYRSGSQQSSGSQSSYGTGSSMQGGNSGSSATTNTGKPSEADEYAGVGRGSSNPRQTP